MVSPRLFSSVGRYKECSHGIFWIICCVEWWSVTIAGHHGGQLWGPPLGAASRQQPRTAWAQHDRPLHGGRRTVAFALVMTGQTDGLSTHASRAS